jgi:hypothetical protein
VCGVSIYASTLCFDDEDHHEGCGRFVPDAEIEGAYSLGPSEDCTCEGKKHAPLIYQGSHVTPTADDPRGGEFDLATIPPHIPPKGENYLEDREWEYQHGFLRVGMFEDPSTYGHDMHTPTILLDREQVTELRNHLTRWLKRGVKW